jgi:excisionase family DNA binding protein
VTAEAQEIARAVVAELRQDDVESRSPNSVAELLDVSPRTVRQWIQDGTIEAFKLGGATRIRMSEVRRLVAEAEADRG